MIAGTSVVLGYGKESATRRGRGARPRRSVAMAVAADAIGSVASTGARRTAGERRVLRNAGAAGRAAAEGAPAIHARDRITLAPDFGKISILPPEQRPIHCKLEVGSATDPLERDADEIADRVVSMPAPQGSAEPASTAASPAGTLQRACAACEAKDDSEDEKVRAKRLNPDDEIHGKMTASPPAMTNGLEHQVRGLGSGQPLPASERAFFEPRFGRDFGQTDVGGGACQGWTPGGRVGGARLPSQDQRHELLRT